MAQKFDYKNLNLSAEQIELIETCDVEILDLESFLEYHKTAKAAEKLKVAKIGGVEISLDTTKDRFFALIMDLPEEIQAKFETKRSNYQKIYNNSLNFKKKAFGIGKNVSAAPKKQNAILLKRKLELLELFGRMFSVKEVLQVVKTEWKNKELTLNDLKEFYVDNLDAINRQIEQHRNDYTNLRLTAKKSRLEELTWAASVLKRKIIKNEGREDIKAYKDMLSEIRKECEGERIAIEGNLNMNIQADINVHLRTQLAKDLNLKEIILGKIAAKNKISGSDLIADLNTSYYGKLNAYTQHVGEYVDFEELGGFPSQQAYDFDKIKRVNDKLDSEEEAARVKAKMKKDAKPQTDIKNKMLERLQKSTNKLNSQK